MCALFGWLDFGGIVPSKILNRFTQSLAIACEERGTDASGIAYLKGGKMAIYKRPKPAHKLKFNVPDGTKAVMGHTRLTTQGNQKYNWNNHPFLGHADIEFAFAHNGVLSNDKELKKSKNLPYTHIETDSYVGVQLLEKSGVINFDSLKSMAEDVRGSFTFTVLDAENSLYFVKGSSPLFLIYFERLGLYAYASTKSIMMTALQMCGLQKQPYQVIDAEEGEIIKIDSNGFLSRDTYSPHYSSFLGGWGYRYDDYYTGQEELLLDICGYFGVDEDDVILLLDYGYTSDEIEEMLLDTDILNETLNSIKGEEDCFKYLVSECY